MPAIEATTLKPALGAAVTELTLSDLFSGMVVALDERALGRSIAAVGASGQPKAISIPDGVRVIDVSGPLLQRSVSTWWADLTGYDAIADQFAAACADPGVQAILLRIDSPGGVVAGCFEAVRRMIEARNVSGKPVVAFADELAASAAYAIACVADAGIIGPASAELGSVGVLCVHWTEARSLEEAGIDVTVFRSGARKADANTVEPLTDAARQSLQAGVDELARDFHRLVAASRGLDESAVKGWEAAVFKGRDAKRMGVADRVGSIEDAAAAALKEARLRQRTKNMKIKAALGLSADATEDEAVEAASKAKAALDAQSALLDAQAKFLEATGAKTVTEALGAIDGLKKSEAALVEARAAAQKLETEKKVRDVEDLVREGREAGKITVATAADWRQDALDDLERTRGKLSRAPVVLDREGPQPPTSPKAAGQLWEDLTATEMAELQKNDPAKFEALLAEYRTRTGNR